MADEEAPKNPEKIEFKKPTLVGRVGKLPKKFDATGSDAKQKSGSNIKEPPPEQSASTKQKEVPVPNAKVVNTPFPYREPKWSGLCPDGSGYALEVLKSGMIIERIDLVSQAYYVFGRLANCDVVVQHPTASRFHAVLQYKAFAEEGEPPSGWYIYDLNSTHGTFHNGVRLKQEHFSRVRVGHQIKFGSSSRTYILMGPDYDCEGESDLTVTEIKQKAKEMKLERERMIQEAIKQREIDKLEEEKKREEQGIDWGMGEDAEEEPDLADNPYAVAANEELYLADPKKTLRGYFEREGLELTYHCEERGVGQFLCRVELPLDDARGRPLVAEVLHRGKKKEAVVACALEACRALDRAGLLRQAKHESRRRKARDWDAEDYYDSDEDPFLDRTGALQRKRRARMRTHGALPPADERPRTYDDLLKEISKIEGKIAAEEKVLERLRAAGKGAAEEASGEDALDQYMSALGRQGHTMAQKADISNAKLTIQKLRGELSRTQRLAQLARPAAAPPLVRNDDKRLLKLNNSVVYGKRIKLKNDIDKKPKPKKEIKTEETEFVEEMDSDEEEKTTEDSGKEEKEQSTFKATVQEESTKMKVEDCETIHDSSRTVRSDHSQCGEYAEDSKKENSVTEKKTDNRHSQPEEDRSKTNESLRNTAENTTKGEQKNSSNTEGTEKAEVKRVFGPMRPPENYVIPDNYFDQETDRDLPEIEESDAV